jgi:endonuclease YncB( thermonuclease family)
MRILLAFCLWILATVAAAEPIAPDEIDITDGDTIDARGYTWRLLGCDTPEFWSRNRKVPLCEKRLALLAAERLQQMVQGGGLTLTEKRCSCPESTIGTKRCNWGRKCGSLTVHGKNVCDVLIAEGLARPYHCGPTRCPRTRPWCALKIAS